MYETKSLADIAEARSAGGIGRRLLRFVRDNLPERNLTIYEAFQLTEISLRLRKDESSDSDAVVEHMNMALLAKLFGEEELYKVLRDETLEIYNAHKRDFIKLNSEEKWNKSRYYIYDNLNGILGADLEALELLSEKRKTTHRNSQKEFPYHWSYFPYDFFPYEDELIKLIKSGETHYEVNKDIAPEICELMVKAELLADKFR